MQHHTPASLAATAVGVSVALQICPQKSQSPLPLPHTTDSQIHSGGWVGLWPWPPHSTSFHSILRIVHPMRPAQPALSDDFREKIKQANPSGGSVCPSSPSSGPSFSLPSVSARRTNKWFFFYVLQMISHEQDPYRLDSVIMHPAITICQGTSAPRTSYRPCGSLRLRAPNLPSNWQAQTSCFSTRFQLQDVNPLKAAGGVALQSGRRPGRPCAARRAFGGNRRLYTLAPPAADLRVCVSTDPPVIYSVFWPCAIQHVLAQWQTSHTIAQHSPKMPQYSPKVPQHRPQMAPT